jgi:hypothetical protein
MKCHTGNALLYRSRHRLLLIAAFLLPVIPSHDMNGHINETAPPLVPIGEVKLVQVQIVVWFVRTCEVWIPFVLHFCLVKCMRKISIGEVVERCSGSFLTLGIVCGCPWIPLFLLRFFFITKQPTTFMYQNDVQCTYLKQNATIFLVVKFESSRLTKFKGSMLISTRSEEMCSTK